MSQKDACGHAEHRAKVKVMNEKIPILLKSEKNVKCTLTKPKSSCKVIYMNVLMGQKDGYWGRTRQRVRMNSCDDEK